MDLFLQQGWHGMMLQSLLGARTLVTQSSLVTDRRNRKKTFTPSHHSCNGATAEHGGERMRSDASALIPFGSGGQRLRWVRDPDLELLHYKPRHENTARILAQRLEAWPVPGALRKDAVLQHIETSPAIRFALHYQRVFGAAHPLIGSNDQFEAGPSKIAIAVPLLDPADGAQHTSPVQINAVAHSIQMSPNQDYLCVPLDNFPSPETAVCALPRIWLDRIWRRTFG